MRNRIDDIWLEMYKYTENDGTGRGSYCTCLYNASKLKKDFGIEDINFENELESQLLWYKKNCKIVVEEKYYNKTITYLEYLKKPMSLEDAARIYTKCRSSLPEYCSSNYFFSLFEGCELKNKDGNWYREDLDGNKMFIVSDDGIERVEFYNNKGEKALSLDVDLWRAR